MLEKFIIRIAASPYKDSFILKGGFLISSIVGIHKRSTMDIDVTIKGNELTLDLIRKIINEIIDLRNDEDVVFKLNNIKSIREHDMYNGFRVSINGEYDTIKVTFKVDITTGDKITPRAINYNYFLEFEQKNISILSYNIETILSEKIETILSRGIKNTRARDFYDVYILIMFHSFNYDLVILKNAIINTSIRRNTYNLIFNYHQIINNIMTNKDMINHWIGFIDTFNYDKDLTFNEVCSCIIGLLDELFK